MAKLKLTDTTIKNHVPTRKDELKNDGNGLSMRFRLIPSESTDKKKVYSKSWVYAYKVGSKSFYLTLGNYDAPISEFDANLYGLPVNSRLTLENAREIVKTIRRQKQRGIDPKLNIQQEIERIALKKQKEIDDEVARLAEIAKAEEEERQNKLRLEAENLSVLQLFEAWTKDGVQRKDGNAMLLRTFKADVLPLIGSKPIREVTESDLRQLLSRMVNRGVNRSAVIMRNDLMQMFVWAEKRQPWRKLLIDGNPMNLIEIEKIVDREYDLNYQRERKLSDEEIFELNAIFNRKQFEYESAIDKRYCSRPISETLQCGVWIMLSTMCRVGEMQMAKWENVDLDAATWFIPKSDVKGNLADLKIFLSDFTLNQFRRLQKATGHSKWCFPARNTDEHVCIKSLSKQIGDRQVMFKKSVDGGERKPMSGRTHDNSLVLAGGKNGAWTPHDLRRTGATLMQSLGVHLDIIDRCQNHVLKGSKVRRHYLQHDYAEEKREAWKRLGDKLSLILDPIENVLPFERKA
ncbi:tyrosine-type recombinase/integrase [Undibacterium cyanobacteriorum]|uniref:Tyrosine-type recombinase/integrase n=1 Tax=Undibacterium cyanobacteriorum TaxID=3073561 RepID=A0ABY9RDR1_9BURK|nr:tyrosine-type recombinase/integrase [Undibacterium sp. 20NA77.5]WMW78994.1 tyrosine-type recombinase/integrase [Undibacterium sp. 20NA77.5]